MPLDTSSKTTSSSATRPASSGTSPERARRKVVLPAPFGPSTATITPRAERPRGVLVAAIHGSEPGLDGEDQQRHRHEGGREDRAERREREADPDRVEGLTEEAAPTEGEEERDAADDWGQDHRQRGERADQVPSAERNAGVDPGEGNAEQEGEGGRRERDDEREPERGQRLGCRQLAERALPRRAREKPSERQDEEGDSDERQRGEKRGRPFGTHGLEKPKPARIFWPSGEVR